MRPQISVASEVAGLACINVCMMMLIIIIVVPLSFDEDV